MSEVFVILVGMKVAIFLAALGIASMELLMNKRRSSIFGLILTTLSFLLIGIIELFSFESAGDSISILNEIGLFSKIFLVVAGLGLIFYFYGLRRKHKKS